MCGYRAASCVVGMILCGCATIPNIEYSYFLSKMDAVASVTQMVTCNADQTITIVNTGSVVPTYSADLNRGPFKVDIAALEGAFGTFADSDVSFGFTEDGRLKSINQNTTGQGDTIIKSITALSTTVASFAGVMEKKADAPPTPCDIVGKWASDKSKPNVVSLSYANELSFPLRRRDSSLIEPTEASSAAHDALLRAGIPLPKFTLGRGSFNITSRAVDLSEHNVSAKGSAVHVTLQKIATVEFQIRADKQNTRTGSKVIWRGLVPVPTGETYDLPIPAAALFGAQKLILQLSDSGQIASVEYGKNTGVAGLANAANNIATMETPATRVGELKAQADLIAQQQRLNRCQANPATCQ